MANTLFILGAGASKQAGAPLMAEFLDRAGDLLAEGQVTDDSTSFQNVFRAVGRLQPLHSKADFDMGNVESVFALMEMGKTLEKFPGCDTVDEINGLITNMKTVITKTIERTLLFPLETANAGGIEYKRYSEPFPYREFVELLQYLREEAFPGHKISVLTFNYDLALDLALMRDDLGPDYCFTASGSQRKIPLLKLHGSLNWVRCPECDRVVAWELEDYLNKHYPPSRAKEKAPLFIGSRLSEFPLSCNHSFRREPAIVPPTWNKEDYHRPLSKVWGRAAQELGDSENIFVIGYSMPESDAFFPHLYALGSVSETPMKRFWVFNPDETGGVKGRFTRLLGPQAQRRFQYFPETFDRAIETIRKEFPART